MELSVHEFISLDGVVQGPGAPEEDPSDGFTGGGWLVPQSTEGQLDPVDSWFRRADAFLLGRTTFELMRGFWPQVVNEPDNIAAVGLNQWKKYVVSDTLADEDTAWGDTTVIRGDVLARIRELKALPGRELQVHGSCRLARTLLDAGLVDVVRLIQVPVVVGSGRRLFADGAVPSTFRIEHAEVLTGGNGAVHLELRLDRHGDTGAGAFAVEDGREVIR